MLSPAENQIRRSAVDWEDLKPHTARGNQTKKIRSPRLQAFAFCVLTVNDEHI